VPFPAVGGSDAIARIISPKLTERLGQQIVVDNRAGAGGSVGTEAAVKATPDGYNMVFVSTSDVASIRRFTSLLTTRWRIWHSSQ
jgi:tripartite-type tricarboxylate transporter receptor subunit TctC